MSPPNSHLSADQLQPLRADLERALARLERSMKTSARAARPVQLDQTSVGRLSRIDAIQNQSLTQGLRAREDAKSALLRGALKRIDQGTYGLCTGCAGPLQFERLSVFPETPTCSGCAG